MTLTQMPEAAGTPAAPVIQAPPAAPSAATARMPDGTLLRTLHWEAAGQPWATALIVHGLGEHAGRYGNVAGPLVAAGVDVHGYDHRGFGESAGPRAWVDRWSRLHDDLEQRLLAVRAVDERRPVVLYGHSMGGLIAGGYVLAEPPRTLPDWLVLSAPGFDDDLGPWRHVAARLLNAVVPRMRISNGATGNGLSHDPAVGRDFERDPLNQTSSTVHFGHEAFAEQARVRAAIASLDRMPIPTYVFHGADDPVVPVSATEPIGTKGNVTRHVHEGLRHEMHHEHEHDHVMAEVVAWLEAQRPIMGARADGV